MDNENEVDANIHSDETSYHYNSNRKGILSSIKLINFMCHEYLEFSVCDHVNFITGGNGSGKSAILSGLIIGLGGKSSATNRGNTIKTFIKNGKRFAITEIILNNRPTDPYRLSDYGSFISIKRRFNTDGMSSYSIGGEKGSVSTKKDELENIMDYFNIQVDNPTTILNQDLARNFLCSSSTNDKYNFFLKATQLDQIFGMITYAENQKKSAMVILEGKKDLLPKLEKQVAIWESRYKNLSNISNLKAKIKKLNMELAWILVREKEMAYKKIEKQMNSFDDKSSIILLKKENLNNDLKEIESSAIKIENDQNALCEKISLAKSNSANFNNEKNDIKSKLKSAANSINGLVADLEDVDDTIKSMEKKALILKKKMDEENQEMAKKREKELHDLKKLLKNNQIDLENMTREENNLKTTQKSQILEINTLNKDINSIEASLKELNSVLKSYMHSKENRLLIFGKNIQKIVDEIDKVHSRGGFRARPLGPIGYLLNVKNKHLALAIEKALFKLLFSFIVTCSDDASVLKNIAKKVCCQISIITDPFKTTIYDIRKYKASTSNVDGAHCLVDVLETKNFQILNTLVDQLHIEQIIMFEDSSNAQTIMQKDSLPPNWFKAYTPTGDTIEINPYRFYSNTNKSVRARILTSNMDQEIIILKKNISQQEENLLKIEDKKNTIILAEKNILQALDSIAKEIMKRKIEISNINMKIDDLMNVSIVSSADISILNEELENQLRLKKEKMKSINDLKHNKREYESSLKAILLKISDISSEINRLKEQDNSFHSDKQKYIIKKQRILNKVSAINQKIEVINSNKSSLTSKLSEIQSIISDYTAKASELCDKITSDRSIESIELEIKQTLEVIAAQEREHGDPDEIATAYEFRKQKLQTIKNEITNFANFINNLEETISKRLENHLLMRNSLSSRASMAFSMILKNRSYEGELKIDHDNQTLDIYVKIPTMDKKSKSDTNQAKFTSKVKRSKTSSQDIGSLSGGERSFATICFIVALWRTMNTPLRCLDEFDVFMDMVNRRYSMDLLLNLAENEHSYGIQFIFLTPLSMDYLRPSKFLNIHRINKKSQKNTTEMA